MTDPLWLPKSAGKKISDVKKNDPHVQKTMYRRENNSASARISKGAGTTKLLKEKGREQFWPKKGNLCRTRKNGQNFTPVNKTFSHTFEHI
jgi:hypothetical protein